MFSGASRLKIVLILLQNQMELRQSMMLKKLYIFHDVFAATYLVPKEIGRRMTRPTLLIDIPN